MAELITFISHVAFDYLIPGTIAIGFMVALVGSILCLHFNYHYFLIHGKILWDLANDKPNEVEKVTEINGLKWTVGVMDVVLSTALTVGVGLLVSIMWPVAAILLVLLVLLPIQKFVFRGRHRKLMFKLKLKGFYRD